MNKHYKVLAGLLSFFLRLDPGMEIYVGNVKVFDFVTQGVADEVIYI